jgi:hypothetical protein
MMNTLFVAWQQPDSKEWIPVAKLEHRNGMYCFSYTQGVYRAKQFRPLGGMSTLGATYESPNLFPLFSNRLISKSRPEFNDYLRWLGLADAADNPMAMLALTGGIRGTDSIELFQPPVVTAGRYQLDFFVRSLSHMPKATIDHIGTMKKADRLRLMRDEQNEFDNLAIALRSDNPAVLLGYCPKYYAKDLGVLLTNKDCGLDVKVKCVNLDAPLNMRLLCTVSASVPHYFAPLESEHDFQPFTGEVPAEWRELTNDLHRNFPALSVFNN